MADALKGFSGNWTFLIAWTFAAGLALAAFALIPGQRLIELHVLPDYTNFDTATKSVAFVAMSSLIAFVVGASSTPLMYRPLEGYYPFPGRKRRQARYVQLKAKMLDEDEYRARELFPIDDTDVQATRLGNAMRALETYSFDRYQFDTIRLWPHLSTVIPKWLQDELDYSRAPVDFFVATYWFAVIIGLTCLVVVFAQFETSAHWSAHVDLPLLVWGLAFLIVVRRLAYEGAIQAVGYWAATVRAMIDLARKPLAASLGLDLPQTLAEERAMWAAFYRINYYKYDGENARRLDRFRSKPPPS